MSLLAYACSVLILCVLFWLEAATAVRAASFATMLSSTANSTVIDTTVVMNDEQRVDFLKNCVESRQRFYPFRTSVASSNDECCLRLARNHLYKEVIEEFESISIANHTKFYYPSVPAQIISTLRVCQGIVDIDDPKQKYSLQRNFSQLFLSKQASWHLSSIDTLKDQKGMGTFPTQIHDVCEGNFTCVSIMMKLCASHIIFTHNLKTQPNDYHNGEQVINTYYHQVINSRFSGMDQTLVSMLWSSCEEKVHHNTSNNKFTPNLEANQIPMMSQQHASIMIITICLVGIVCFSIRTYLPFSKTMEKSVQANDGIEEKEVQSSQLVIETSSEDAHSKDDGQQIKPPENTAASIPSVSTVPPFEPHSHHITPERVAKECAKQLQLSPEEKHALEKLDDKIVKQWLLIYEANSQADDTTSSTPLECEEFQKFSDLFGRTIYFALQFCEAEQKLKDSKSITEKEMEELRNQCVCWQNKFEQQASLLNITIKERDHLKEKVAQTLEMLRETHERFMKESENVQQIKTENENLAFKNKEAEEKYDTLTKQMENFHSEMVQLKARKLEFEMELEKTKKEIEQNIILQQQIESECHEKGQQIEVKDRQIEELTKRVNDTSLELESVKQRCEKLKINLDELENEKTKNIDELQQQMQTLKDCHQTKEETFYHEKIQLNEHIKQLENKLEKAKQEFISRSESLEKTIEELQDEKQAILTHMQKQKEDLEKQLEKLQEDLKDLKNKYQTLKNYSISKDSHCSTAVNSPSKANATGSSRKVKRQSSTLDPQAFRDCCIMCFDREMIKIAVDDETLQKVLPSLTLLYQNISTGDNIKKQ
ncbi:hypothetical protein C9374_005136 [Naegleria lovaniensis]|uniref:Viral A-type inclusion protein n=1 Tax=Naegleria lovaniensis TaxID=51637 RepID=A0AA88GNV1_NAELO|nr:uncharacterized protein C9374_005136 [Naegleria lovaniensis]KAG2382556.1 hypothetical protein C9374_005136 [Naegleria lovaniensis]